MLEDSTQKQTGKIVEWDDQKGYGYLQTSRARIFLHRRDFVRRHKHPEIGDVVSFKPGKDAKGRPCAINACHINDGGKITIPAALAVMGLLILPSIALMKHAVDLLWVGLYVPIISWASYCCYANDKRRAQNKEWRISENTLHLTALLGGWPGAFLAQRRFRHKVSKFGFQFVFWLTVALYQFAAFDSLQEWRYSKQMLKHLQGSDLWHR